MLRAILRLPVVKGPLSAFGSPFPNLIHMFNALRRSIVPFKLSDIGEGITEVQMKEWHVQEGDAVKQFDNLCDVQSDKASATITSRYDGIIKKIYWNVDDVVRVGSTLVDIETDDNDCQVIEESKSAGEDSPPANKAVEEEEASAQKPLTSPAVRRLAKENKIDLRQILPTGPEGRILKEDVLKYMEKLDTGDATAKRSAGDQIVPNKGFARVMSKTMSLANRIPHFTYCDEVDMSEIMALKSNLKTVFEEHNLSMSILPFYIKSLSIAMLRYPMINSHYDETTDGLVYKGAHNISVAIASPQGLIVPCVKSCETKNIVQIASELTALRQKANRGLLGQEELADGTVTLSNIGSIGGTHAKPILLPPQVAICAIGRVQVLPRYRGGDQIVRPTSIATVSWSADHRVLDGATVARFNNFWKQLLEQPLLMLTHLR